MLITTVCEKQEVSQSAVLSASGALPTIKTLFSAIFMKDKKCHGFMLAGTNDTLMTHDLAQIRQRQFPIWAKMDPMNTSPDPYQDIRDAVRALCAQFPDEYHRKVDEKRGYPEEFVDALTKAGWMAALIPQQYGGSGLSMAEASVIMEEINRSGGNSGACHGQMYVMNAIVRSGSDAQKNTLLPKIATGELRIQSMGVTEPTTGSDTTQLKTTAVKKDGRWVINGQKVWT